MRTSRGIPFAVVTVPVALGLLAWGYGGEDLIFKGAAAALLCLTLAVRGGGGAPAQSWLRPAGWLVALAIASVAWASNHYVALVDAAFLLLVAGVFVAMASAPRNQVETSLALCTMVIAAFSLYGFVQLAGHAPAGFWHNGQFSSRYVNSAHFASLVAVAVPVGMGLALRGPGTVTRFGAGLSVPVNLVALMLTRSRAVWILSAILYAVLVLLLVRNHRRSGAGGRWGWVVIAISLLTVGVAFWFLRDGIATRFHDLLVTRGQGLNHRWQVWRDGFRMFKSEPLGVGMGCFGESYLTYKSTVDRGIALRAHNEIVQVTAELGWVSVPLLLWLAWSGVRTLFRARREEDALWSNPLSLCVAAGLVLVAAHSLVDFPLRLGANALYVAVALSVLVAQRTVETDATVSPPKRRGVLQRLLCGVGAMLWGCVALSTHYAERGYALSDRAEYAKALPLLTQAAALMPLDPIVAYERGKACRSLALFAGARRRRGLEEAAGHLRWAIRLAPARPKPHALLARTLHALGDREGAVAELQAAMRCDPTLGLYRSNYADLLLEEGRFDEAVEQYHHALSLFRDSSALTVDLVLDKVFKATGDVTLLRRTTPPDERSQGILTRFLRKKAHEGGEVRQ